MRFNAIKIYCKCRYFIIYEVFTIAGNISDVFMPFGLPYFRRSILHYFFFMKCHMKYSKTFT